MPNGVSRAAIEVLLDRVNQGVSILSPEGRITYANQRLAAMLGLARMQVVGKPLADLVAQADREALALALSNGRDVAAQCRVALQRRTARANFRCSSPSPRSATARRAAW